jgi:hypothetical protein
MKPVKRCGHTGLQAHDVDQRESFEKRLRLPDVASRVAHSVVINGDFKACIERCFGSAFAALGAHPSLGSRVTEAVATP